ncbi:hypothetical protein ACNZ6X_001959 [Enterococcus faecium]
MLSNNGVDEKNNFEFYPLNDDHNRKNSNELTTFLRDKKFFGGIRPSISLQTITVERYEIDVLTVKNDTHTPYYLTAEQYAIMDNQENTAVINEHDSFIREKKKEIMLEALFSRYYTLDIKELVKDANKVEFANTCKQGEFDRGDMRAFDRFNNWESYVDEKQ